MPAQDRFFITTAIPYVNSRPHIGHALEFVQTDTFARYHRLRGDDTYFLSGTDENALKNVQAAEREGIPTRALVDRNSRRFEELREHLDLSFDQFIRTAADPRHAAGAEKIWRAAEASGDIYRKFYSGLYCVGCEQYYNPSELIDGLCPEHGTPPDLIEEENHFFRLSRYTDQLYDLIASDRYRVVPETRKNEVLSFIARGLQDFSVSRSQERARGWGIPVPGDPSQVIYVWFDALANYITALDYADEGELYRRYWLENPHRVHVIGKGIIRFHAIYWPAMLLSAGVPLPEMLFVHGYINVSGAKISKSLGNVVDPVELVQTWGTDAVRYYLLRGVSPTGDANFSPDYFEARYNADLANDLGNLLNRTVSMIGRYRAGAIPGAGEASDLERSVREVAARAPQVVQQAMDRYDPQAALDAVWELVTRANKYVEESAPWALARTAHSGDGEADARLSTALYTLAESLRIIAALLEPFLPGTAGKILDQLGVRTEGGIDWQTRLQWGGTAPGTTVSRAQPIFPRLEQV
ncbi:MAG: methionine--tRNA ligase, partial [Chloroflexi bacterium]|nr:methionine--tRNA ligase [Chloroflexota bacterium]